MEKIIKFAAEIKDPTSPPYPAYFISSPSLQRVQLVLTNGFWLCGLSCSVLTQQCVTTLQKTDFVFPRDNQMPVPPQLGVNFLILHLGFCVAWTCTGLIYAVTRCHIHERQNIEKIKLVPTWKCHPYWLVLRILEACMPDNGWAKLSSVSPRCELCNNNNMPGREKPTVQ